MIKENEDEGVAADERLLRETMIAAGGRTIRVDKNRSAYTIDITREGPWGNPFKAPRDGTREEVIAKFKAWALLTPSYVALVRSELKGQVLGCTCKIDLPCHGDVLVAFCDGEAAARAELAEGEDP